MHKLEYSFKRINSYFRRWKIKLNEGKSEAIYFTKRMARRFIPAKELVLNSTPIRWSRVVKYLGLFLDEKLTFKKHVERTNERVQGLGDCATTHRNALQVSQNKSFKVIHDLPFHYRTLDLHSETNVRLIDDLIIDLKTKFLGGCYGSSNPLISEFPST